MAADPNDKNNNKAFEVPITKQTLTKEEMSKKREQVMAQRNRKLQERMAAMAQRRMKRTGNSRGKQQKQALQLFLKEFSTMYDEIEDDINNQKTFQQFKDLKMRVFKLESHLADNAAILPSYTFEAKNRMMTNLKKKINIRQEQVAPKPKFTFSKKFKKSPEKSGIKTEPKTIENTDKKPEDEKIDILAKLGVTNDEITIANKSLETIYKESGSINGSDICLSNLTNCTISICDYIGALRMNNIKYCTIITGPIASSLHVEYIENSTINSIMRQCRIHYCKNTKFYIHVNSEPVIEYSDNVQFAPYNVRYKELNKHWEQSKVDKDINRWDKVKDFNWFKQQHSPHWTVIPKAERNEIARPVIDDDSDDEL
eukprot:130213_1